MSSCIKDLYDYEIAKKCSKYGNTLLISNFYKKTKIKEVAIDLSVCLVVRNII